MNPHETSQLIARAGGNSAFGRLLGLDTQKGWQQRVNNWKRRGLPAAVWIQNYERIQELRAKKRPR